MPNRIRRPKIKHLPDMLAGRRRTCPDGKTSPVTANRLTNMPCAINAACPTLGRFLPLRSPPRPLRLFGRSLWRLGTAIATAILSLTVTAHALAADPETLQQQSPRTGQTGELELTRGSSDRDVKRAAIEQIPWEKLSPQYRERVLEVVNRSAMFRRMPSRIVQCEPDFYQFLVENPDVVVGIWQVLGVTKMRLERRADGDYFMDDAAGTLARLQYILVSPNCHVVYAEGQYSGPLMLRPVQGRCIVVLNSSYIREKNGTAYVSADLDLFVEIDRAGLELLTKAMNPFFGAMAENNYRQTFAFLGSLYRTAEVRGTAMRHLAGQLTKVSPTVREQFVQLIADATRRGSQDPLLNPENNPQPEVAETPNSEHDGPTIR